MTNAEPELDPPAVPGYRTGALLGRGAHGEVWLGHDLDSGEQVALKVRRNARARRAEDDPAGGATVDDAEAAAVLAREVAVLRRLRHRHVIGLRRVVDLAGGGRAMVLDHAAGGSVAALVRRRGALSSGEASTLLVPLARALSDVHADGLVHGDIAPGNVLLTAQGRPLLSDLGTAQVLGGPLDGSWGTPGYLDPDSVCATAAGDLRALAAVGWFALTGAPPAADPQQRAGELAGNAAGDDPEADVRLALLRLLDQGLAADAAARPAPMGLAWSVWEIARPVPVRLALPSPPAPAAGPAPDRRPPDSRHASADDITHRIRVEAAAVAPAAPPRRRLLPASRPHRWLLPAGLFLALAGSVLAGAHWFGDSPPAAAAAPAGRRAASAPVPPADVSGLVRQFVARRAEAFGTASVAPLADVDEAGSAAMRQDAALVNRLRERGLTLAGLSFTVQDARLLPAAPGELTIAARVRTSAHRQVRIDGTVVGLVPQGQLLPVRLVLASTAAGEWRVRATA